MLLALKVEQETIAIVKRQCLEIVKARKQSLLSTLQKKNGCNIDFGPTQFILNFWSSELCNYDKKQLL